MDLNSRLKIIEDLDCFLDDQKRTLSNVLSAVNWSEESLTDEVKVQCSRDPNHWVPESSLFKHIKACSLAKEGYLKEDVNELPPDSEFFYQKASSVIPVTIDKEAQANILRKNGLLNTDTKNFEAPDIAKTLDRWCVELNAEQRLAIYDYVVKESKSVKQPTNVTLEDLMFDFEKKNDEDGKPKSSLELLAEQRDYKRRRQSYRAKNVHITKKSYTEVMKEVIENQITYLAETRKQETNEKDEDNSANNSEQNHDDEGSSNDSRRKEFKYRQSHDSRSRSVSPKKHKHKHKRSRSRSRGRHKHKKSHKHKKARD